MRLSPLTRSVLVVLPLLLCAGRLHATRTRTPAGLTQEVNRCLTLVRVASSRRKRDRSADDTQRFGSAGISAAGVSQPLAKTA